MASKRFRKAASLKRNVRRRTAKIKKRARRKPLVFGNQPHVSIASASMLPVVNIR